jgi:hypothetical protein
MRGAAEKRQEAMHADGDTIPEPATPADNVEAPAP